MKKFNIRIVFKNNTEEFKIINAKTISEAKKICEQMCKENKETIEKCTSKNIYTTRIIKECTICNLNWRDELLDFLSEDNI